MTPPSLTPGASMRRMVAIGGIDPSGGAGVELDVKVGEAFDVHVHPVTTMITFQTPSEYLGGECLGVDTVINQLKPYKEVKYWKTGALCNSEILRAIKDLAVESSSKLIVDPVMRASAGGTLFSGSVDDYRELLKVSYAVTPNVNEAEMLAGIRINSVEDMKKAAKIISEMGPELVIVTGGHMDELVDVVYWKGATLILKGRKKLPIHGSGSALASALASRLARGDDPLTAARRAIGFTRLLHSFARDVEGRVPDPLIALRVAYHRFECHERFRAFIKWLESLSYEKAKKIAPEVGLNVACAVPKHVSRGIGTVMGVPGRLHLTPEGLRKVSCPWWGGSDHLARLLINARKYGDVNVAMNIRYSPENVEKLREAGYVVVEVDRSKQPRGIKTMAWVVSEAVTKAGKLPDVIYDKGFYGKEAMIRLLAQDLCELKRMVEVILR